MHTTMTTTVAREIVADRIRGAEHARLVRAVRRTRKDLPVEQPRQPTGAGWNRRFRRFRIVPAH